jgi:hypothetical protein
MLEQPFYRSAEPAATTATRGFRIAASTVGIHGSLRRNDQTGSPAPQSNFRQYKRHLWSRDRQYSLGLWICATMRDTVVCVEAAR